MPVPTHDITCITKAFLTTCPSCGTAAWFFSCSCGSKVFFEQLGYPWEIHECREYRLKREVLLIQHSERLSSDEIFRMITAHEKRSGVDIDEKVLEMIEDVLGRRKYPLSLNEVVPAKGLNDISGKIMTLNNPVNIFKKLDYPPTEMGKKMLAPIGGKQWAQIVVRTRPDKRNRCLEYLCYVEVDYIKKNSLKQGDYIVGIITGVGHRKGTIWILQSHTVL